MKLRFVMPVHGRENLTGICLRQLRRTCDALTADGIDAGAVVVGDDRNLDVAWALGFATVRRDNDFLARRFNDGLQLACDPSYGIRADYAIPIGSDDWVDHRIFHRLPGWDTVLGFRHCSFVSEDGTALHETRLNYEGGTGIRVYPAQMLKTANWRPADEDRKRGCDTSILYNTRWWFLRAHSRDLRVTYGDRHPHQIVDWKTPGQNLNEFAQVTGVHRSRNAGDPFQALTGMYPADLLEEMRCHYSR